MARAKKTVNYFEAGEMPFPKRLRLLLETSGETQEKLAKAIGANRQSIGQWKDGITTPDINALNKIADYYKVSTDYLLGRIDVKSPEVDYMAIHEKTGLSVESIKKLSEYNKSIAVTYTQNDAIVMEQVTLKEYQNLSKKKDVRDLSVAFVSNFIKTIDVIIKDKNNIVEDLSKFLFSKFINNDAEHSEVFGNVNHFNVREKGSKAFQTIDVSIINETYLLQAQHKLLKIKEELSKESE